MPTISDNSQQFWPALINKAQQLINKLKCSGLLLELSAANKLQPLQFLNELAKLGETSLATWTTPMTMPSTFAGSRGQGSCCSSVFVAHSKNLQALPCLWLLRKIPNKLLSFSHTHPYTHIHTYPHTPTHMFNLTPGETPHVIYSLEAAKIFCIRRKLAINRIDVELFS